MPQRPNETPGAPEAPNHSSVKEQQDTLLLGDVPDISELMPDASTQATLLAPHLSSAALSALSQRYDILAEAGHGSMGNVYKARDRETGEVVALKLLKPEIASDQAMMDRFKNELLFARKITHKNVCRVHEFNRIGGVAYTSMEFVEGESLRSALTRFGTLPTRKAVDLALQICSGLKEAHTQGIVHRDLKPENVMIDAQGNVKIMDFGIARSMEAVTRLTGSMVGTPAYMAPEQVGGKPVDYRTDVYSLGLILYELFTGTQAFRADNAVAVALKQMRESAVPPHEIDPQIPVPIERAILKCIEKEPEKRFQSIAHLENALRPLNANSTFVPAAGMAAAVLSTNSGGSTALRTSPPLRPAPAPRRGMSPAVWASIVALVLLGALAAVRAGSINRAAVSISPPASMPAPRPPDFAFVVPPRAPAQLQAAAPKPVAPQPAKAKAPESTAAQAATPAQPPSDTHRRAQNAFGESHATRNAAGPDSRPGYIWVGRFEREDRAKSAAKKIQDLGGLAARVVTRWNLNGKFFVVWAGPFPAKALSANLDWIQAQGFTEAHEVKVPDGEMLQRFNRDRNQGQNAEHGQNSDQAPHP
ncbi:MAG TPA: serine/threonine-protein kinase [Candidatus Aquilonibacter sp.]|nr:serine/threonine-protein kinase [Candidatus Aquilonibacter sp.]